MRKVLKTGNFEGKKYRDSRTSWLSLSQLYVKFWSHVNVSNFGHKMLKIDTGIHELYGSDNRTYISNFGLVYMYQILVTKC